MASTAPDPGESAPADRNGLEDIRRRLKALEAPAPPGERRHRNRSAASVLLLVLTALLSLLSAVSVWAASIVDDTDRYVATVAPLAGNPDVQRAVTDRVTAVVLQRIDIGSLVDELSRAAAQQGVPPRAAQLITGLSGPINSGLTDLVSGTVHRVVSSGAFNTIWVDANRLVHTAMDKALTGKGGGAVVLRNNQVAVDVAPVIARVKDELVKAGFKAAGKIPVVHTDFVVFASKDIGKVRTYVRLLQLAGTWLPVVTVLIAAAGVFLAADRRRALIGAALGVAAAMLVLGIALSAFRAVYLDRLPPGVSQPAAAAVFDALVRFLRSTVRAVGTLALVTAIAAFLVGPSRAAVTIRTAGRTGIGAVRDVAAGAGLRLGPVGRFVHRSKRWLGVAILAVAAALFITWDHPTTAVVLWFAVTVLAAFTLREFLDTGP